MLLNTENLTQAEINEQLRSGDKEWTLTGCLGQRFIAAGMSDLEITIEGVPGNALGAYLNGAHICVSGNAQDAVGDTMNDGEIIIHGSAGDAVGYAMRGGAIYIQGNVGYRAGIHMKEYQTKRPVIVIGGAAGSFLGEYQAGGLIIVLGLGTDERIVSNFPCTGMHGGKMILRSDCKDIVFPKGVTTAPMTREDLDDALPYLKKFCESFLVNYDELMDSPFTVVVPDSHNPYKQMYVPN